MRHAYCAFRRRPPYIAMAMTCARCHRPVVARGVSTMQVSQMCSCPYPILLPTDRHARIMLGAERAETLAKHHRRVDPHSRFRVQRSDGVRRNVNFSDNIDVVTYDQYDVVSTSHLSSSRVLINVVFEHLAIGDGDGGSGVFEEVGVGFAESRGGHVAFRTSRG